MNSATKAQAEAAKYNAKAAKRDASNLMTTAQESAESYTERANSELSQAMAILGKTGNLSTEENAAKTSDIDVGSYDTEEVKALRSESSTLAAELAKTEKTITTESTESGGGVTSDNPEYTELSEKLKDVNEKLSIIGTGGGGTQIEASDALLHASGSDLLTMVSTRDALERDKRTQMRNYQTEAMSYLNASEQYEEQAGYLEDAASWDTWSTILGAGTGILSLGTSWGWF
jgi:hypothetical protein